MTLNIILITFIGGIISGIIGTLIAILYIQEPLLEYRAKRSTEKQQRKKELEELWDQAAHKIISNPLIEIGFRQRYMGKINKIYFIIMMMSILCIGIWIYSTISDYIHPQITIEKIILTVIFIIIMMLLSYFLGNTITSYFRFSKVIKRVNKIKYKSSD